MHHIVERLGGRQTGEDDVGLSADIGGGARRQPPIFSNPASELRR
jgi:hypothetical protein